MRYLIILAVILSFIHAIHDIHVGDFPTAIVFIFVIAVMFLITILHDRNNN